MRSVINKICLSVAVVGVLGCSVFAQVNILSDVINFRTNVAADYLKTTNMYGVTKIWGSVPAVPNVMGVSFSVYDKTALATEHAAIYGSASMLQGYGFGAFLKGGQIGVFGLSGTPSTGPTSNVRYGGYFASTGAVAPGYNVGVSATTTGGNPNTDWAAYFIGRTFCTSGQWTPSDSRFKKDVEDLNGSLEKVMQLKPKSYLYDTQKFKAANFSDKKQCGLIAQELEEIFPEFVTDVAMPSNSIGKDKGKSIKGSDGEDITISECESVTYKAANYTALIPVLIKAIQEQQNKMDKQQKQIDALTALAKSK